LPLRSHHRVINWLRWLQVTTLRIGANEILMLTALLIVVLGTWGFVELTGNVLQGSTQGFDQWAVDSFHELVNRYVPLPEREVDQIMMDISALGGPTVLALVVLAVLGYLVLEKRRNALFLVLSATAGGLLLAWGLKEIIARPRPDALGRLQLTYLSSFPSGHSLLSVIIYPTLGTLLARVVTRKRLKLYFLLVGLTVSGMVGLSRVYLRVHFPTDVLAGWAVGLAWAALCWTVTKWLQRRGAVEGGEDERVLYQAD